MAYTRDDGTTTPNLAGLIQLPSGFRINDGTFVLTDSDIFDTATVRSNVTVLSSDHGGYAGAAFYNPFEFTIEGYLTVPTLADVWAAKDDLEGAFNLDAGLQVLTLNTSGWSATRQVTARVNGPVQFLEPQMLGKLLPDRNFVIPMVAPDPRRYSTTEHSQTITSATGVTNAGKLSTPLKVRFNGPQTDPKIDVAGTSGTARIKFTGTITSGHWVEVNTYSNGVMTALDDSGGNAYYGGTYGDGISKATLKTLPAGATSLTATNTSGAGSTVVKWRDAW